MTYREHPVFVPSGSDSLCAVLTSPAAEDVGDVGAVLVTGHRTRTHRNRMYVRVARDLAARGIPSIRFDQRGTGDSTGTLRIDLRSPFGDDVAAASDFLVRATGVSRVVLLSTCVGGASGMTAAARHRAVAAVVAFTMPVLTPRRRRGRPLKKRVKRWVRRRLPLQLLVRLPGAHRLRRRKSPLSPHQVEVSPAFREALLAAVRRGVQVRFVFGEHAGYLRGMRWCLQEAAPELTPAERGRIRLEVVRATELHRFMSLEEQDVLVAEAVHAMERILEEGFAGGPAEEIAETIRSPVGPVPVGQAGVSG
jgi:pimeloyl-ACP methyl ester carboxylesterase